MARIAVRLENDPQLAPQDFQEMASLAESRGYEMVWVPEGSGRDSLTQLTFLAAHTDRIKLATGILPIYYRTPMLTAMSAAGLGTLSQGRFVLGLGVGHRPSVEGTHGVPFRRPLTRMRETVTLVQSLLRGEQVAHAGRIFNVGSASLGPAAPESKVPIYIAALGPQMLELTGELADGVLLNWTAASYLEQAIHHLRRGAEQAGRDPAEIDIAGYVRVAVVEGDDLAEARASLQGQIARYASNPFYRNFFQGMGFAEEMAAAEEAMQRGDPQVAANAISQEMQDQVAVVGNPEECRAEIEKRRALGLQLPVVAPFTVAEPKESYRRVINAFEG